MPEITLTKADNGGSVSLPAGSNAVIELDENPTTGYLWALDDPLPPGLTLASSNQSPATSAIGAGGTRRFTLQAEGVGGGLVSLKRWREWAGDASVVERYRVTIHVS